MTLSDLQRLLRPLGKQLANLVSRAVVSRVDDGTKFQTLQVKAGVDEVRDGLERFQQYGLTSVPAPDAEAVVLFVGGRRDVGYVVAVDDRRYRPTGLAEGEVALYNKAGALVVLKADGSIEVNPAPGQVVKLAGEADAVALASKVAAELEALKTAIDGWAPIASDGGAALKAALGTLFTGGWPASVASGKVKAE